MISSSIIDARYVVDWTQERWAQEFDDLASAGINEVVLQATAEWTSAGIVTYYPSTVAGTTQFERSDGAPADVVGPLLDQATAHAMKVWIGLYRDERPNRFAADSSIGATMAEDLRFTKQLVDDVWNQHWTEHSTIQGWYLPAEINTNYTVDPGRTAARNYYADAVSYLHSTNNKYPVMVSPYFSTDAGASASMWRSLWAEILRGAPIDVIGLQDGTGDIPGHPRERAELDTTLSTWFGATRSAITDAATATELRSNVNLYEFTGGSALIRDIARNTEAVAGIVDSYTSFSFTNQIAPWTLGTTSYYEPFLLWNTTGQFLPGNPSTPVPTIGPPDGHGNRRLAWQSSTAANGKHIAYYRTYRASGTSRTYVATSWSTDAEVSGLTAGDCVEVVSFDTTGDESGAGRVCVT